MEGSVHLCVHRIFEAFFWIFNVFNFNLNEERTVKTNCMKTLQRFSKIDSKMDIKKVLLSSKVKR